MGIERLPSVSATRTWRRALARLMWIARIAVITLTALVVGPPHATAQSNTAPPPQPLRGACAGIRAANLAIATAAVRADAAPGRPRDPRTLRANLYAFRVFTVAGCRFVSGGAWAVVLEPYATWPAPRPNASTEYRSRWHLEWLANNGARTPVPWQQRTLPGAELQQPPQLFDVRDFDGDGIAEAILTIPDATAMPQMVIATVRAGVPSGYAPLMDLGVRRFEDLDGDGQRDAWVQPILRARASCDRLFDAEPVRIPARLLANGTLVRDDALIRAVVRVQCPRRPTRIYPAPARSPATDDVLATQADVDLAATNAICARLWGVAPDAIRAMAARDVSAARSCVQPDAFAAVAASFAPPFILQEVPFSMPRSTAQSPAVRFESTYEAVTADDPTDGVDRAGAPAAVRRACATVEAQRVRGIAAVLRSSVARARSNADNLGRSLDGVGTCSPTLNGAWSLSMSGVRWAGGTDPEGGLVGRWSLAFHSARGVTSRLRETFLLAGNDFLHRTGRVRWLFDFDGDSSPEAVVRFVHWEHEGDARPQLRIFTARGGAVSAYGPAPQPFDEMADVDRDGRPDLLDTTRFRVEDDCMGASHGTYLHGPVLAGHSLASGAFSWDDAAARSYVQQQCPASPSQLTVPRADEQPARLDDEPMVMRIVCARFWGESPEAVMLRLAGEIAANPTLRSECMPLTRWSEVARMPVPFTLR